MRGRVRLHDRRHPLGNQTGEPLLEAHPHMTDARKLKPHSGGKHEVTTVRFQEIDRGDIRPETPLDQTYDIFERFVSVARMGNQLADFLQGQEQRTLMGGGSRA